MASTPSPPRPGSPSGSAPPSGVQPIRESVREILRAVGEDPERSGLLDTPDRVERAWGMLTSGYSLDPLAILRGAIFEEECSEMVIVREIELYSLCEHHLLPFFGKAHIAYLPQGRIVGLSKLARLVDVFARRLQVQERLTSEIAQALQDALDPLGVAVLIEARHLCMMMRGVEKQNSFAVTSCMLGAFRSDSKCRNEFLELVGNKHSL